MFAIQFENGREKKNKWSTVRIVFSFDFCILLAKINNIAARFIAGLSETQKLSLSRGYRYGILETPWG